MFDFFSCDNCLHSPKVLFSWFSLKFLFLFVRIYRSTVCAQTDSKRTSEIFVNRLCTKGQQTDVQNICQPFVHKCSVDDLCTNVPTQIVHRNICCPIHRTANGQRTDIQNICQSFDICNLLLCTWVLSNSWILITYEKNFFLPKSCWEYQGINRITSGKSKDFLGSLSNN